MTTPSLSISRLINVTVSLSPTAPQAQDIDSAVIIGTSDVINAVERMRTYGSLEEVAADFSNSDEEYLGAVLWFEQNPQPTFLNIGRWVDAQTNFGIISGPVSAANQVVSAWTGISSGAFLITTNLGYQAVTAANFSSVTNLNGVASAVTSAASGFDVTWFSNSKTFQMFASNSFCVSGGFIEPPTAVGSLTLANSGPPVANDTFTMNGTTITFVASGATGNQVNVTNAADMVTALATLINSSSNVQISKFEAIPVLFTVNPVLSLRAKTSGSGGNSLTLAKSGTGMTLSASTLAGATGTDISGMLAMLSSSSGAYVVPGTIAETALEAVQILDNQFGQKWYAAVVPSADDDDHLAIAAYLEGTTAKHYYGVTTQEGGVLVANTSDDIAAQLKALSYKKTGTQYSSLNSQAVVSMLARILTTQWNENNSTITLAYKQEPGIVAEQLTANQLTNLHNKNANVFVAYNNDTAIMDPLVVSASGDPIDTIIGLDWFATDLQNEIYTLLYLSKTKIPQTDAGNHLIATKIAEVCQRAVNNGLVAPGVWRQAGFGAIQQDQFLPSGFYIYQPSITLQSQGSRAARESVPFQVALCLAGSVEKVNVSVQVNA